MPDYLIQVFDTNSNAERQTVQIQISWLLKKPTDLDLHCLQRQNISGFSRTRVKISFRALSCKRNLALKLDKIHYSGYIYCAFDIIQKVFFLDGALQPAHDKIYNKPYVTSKDSDQHVHPPSMARVLVIHL